MNTKDMKKELIINIAKLAKEEGNKISCGEIAKALHTNMEYVKSVLNENGMLKKSELEKEILSMIDSGESMTEISRKCNCSRQYVYLVLEKNKRGRK